VVQQANKSIVVADHSKFGNPNFIKVCDFDAIDMVVVDRLPPENILQELREAGVEVITGRQAEGN
jgi:DeoR/GlpR family transcriptional regulator of sugar metabolism